MDDWKHPFTRTGLLGEELVLTSSKGAGPRGFAGWEPSAKSERLLSEVHAVLDEYRAHGPLTARQVFYRLVGREILDKSEAEYVRLCDLLARARRSGRLSFDAVRDDGVRRIEPFGYADQTDFELATVDRASAFKLDRQQNQPVRMWVLCEAAGMAPMLASAAEPLGVPVWSGGGFDSLTSKHTLAYELARFERTVVLHVGDRDPSGVHLFQSLAEDVCSMAWATSRTLPEFVRLAVTDEQVDELGLPTASPKASDNRSFSGEAVQAEAIPPDVLVALVREAIGARQDASVMEATLEEEHVIRLRLLSRWSE